MSLRFADHFVAAICVSHHCNLIAHGSTSHEKAGFLAQHACADAFQFVDSRVFSVYIVPHFGCGHGRTHFLRRLCHRVAAQINQFHRRSNSSRLTVNSIIVYFCLNISNPATKKKHWLKKAKQSPAMPFHPCFEPAPGRWVRAFPDNESPKQVGHSRRGQSHCSQCKSVGSKHWTYTHTAGFAPDFAPTY